MARLGLSPDLDLLVRREQLRRTRPKDIVIQTLVAEAGEVPAMGRTREDGALATVADLVALGQPG